MKKITLLLGIFLIAGALLAQDGKAPLSKGERQLNFGLGFNDWGLPVYAGMDFAVHDDVTVGPMINTVIGGNNAYLGIAGRGDYHFNRIIGIPSEFDFYAGANVGVRMWFDEDNNSSNMSFGIQVGGRWYWSDQWALNLELGGGTGFGTSLGVSMKL